MRQLLEYLRDYRQYLPIILTIIGFLTGRQGWENLNIIQAAENPPLFSAYGNVAGHGLISFALFSSAFLLARRKDTASATDLGEPALPAEPAPTPDMTDVEFCSIQRRLNHFFSKDPPARGACLTLWQRFFILLFGDPEKPLPPPPAPPEPEPEPEPQPVPEPEPEPEPEPPLPEPEPLPDSLPGHWQSVLSELQRVITAGQAAQQRSYQPVASHSPTHGKDASHDISRPPAAPVSARTAS